METKNFILVLMFLLLIPLFVVAYSGMNDGVIKTSNIVLTIETTSDWTEVRFDGATIRKATVKDLKGEELKKPVISANAVLLEKNSPLDESYSKIELSVALDIREDVVGMIIDKGDLGSTNVSIEKVGEFQNDKGSTKVPLKIITTSNWTMVTFDGMSIVDAELRDFEGKEVKKPIISSNAILLDRYTATEDVIEAEYILDVKFTKEIATLTIDKGDSGYTMVDMGEFGVFENYRSKGSAEEIIEVPVSIETTSNFTGIRFQGAEIKKVDIIGTEGKPLKDKIVGENFMGFLFNSKNTGYGKVRTTIHLKNSSNLLTMTIDNDGGYTIVSFGDKKYVNFAPRRPKTIEEEKEEMLPIILKIGDITIDLTDYRAGFNLTSPDETRTKSIISSISYVIPISEIPRTLKEIKNIRFVMETTSDSNKIIFDGAYIKRAQITAIEGSPIKAQSTGLNYINLSHERFDYTHKKIAFFSDMVFYGDSFGMRLEKGDFGYTLVNINDLMGFVNVETMKPETNNSVFYLVTLNSIVPEDFKKFPEIRPSEKPGIVTLSLSIETTSDWTNIGFEGADIVKSDVESAVGQIGQPIIGQNAISLTKSKPQDTTPAKINLMIDLKMATTKDPDRIRMTIEKGDLGYTRVYSEGIGSFINDKNVRNDPRNPLGFMISLKPQSVSQEFPKMVFSNPVLYSIFTPEFGDNVQYNWEEYVLYQKDLPGRRGLKFDLRPSTRIGLLSGILLSYLMLSILGVHVLRKEGYFVVGEKREINRDYVFTWVRKTFEKIPVGSLYVLLALVTLFMTAFVLMVSQTAAEATAIAAYFFLVIGVLLRLFGHTRSSEKIFNYIEPKTLMFIVKSAAVVAMLSAGIAVGYEFLGKKGLLIMSIPSMVFLFVLYRYITRRLDESEHVREW